MEKHELTRMTALCAQVCSEGTEEEALAWVRYRHQAGTTNNWCKSDHDEHKPVVCADYPDRKHYVFIC